MAIFVGVVELVWINWHKLGIPRINFKVIKQPAAPCLVRFGSANAFAHRD